MYLLLLSTGLICALVAIALVNKIKATFSTEELVDYVKKTKPAYIRFYLLSLSPLVFMVYSLLADGLGIIDYFWYIVLIAICLDALALFKLKKAILRSPFSSSEKLLLPLTLLQAGKTILILSFKLYLNQLA